MNAIGEIKLKKPSGFGKKVAWANKSDNND